MATLAFASCQKDNLGTEFGNDPNAVRINAAVGEGIAITRSNPIGTVEEQKQFDAGDQISVKTGAQAAVIYTLGSGSKWTPEANKYLRWETNTMIFIAYYPVTAGTSAEAFTLPTDQSTMEKLAAADYMTFSDSKTKTDAHTVDLKLNRKTARVVTHVAGFNDQYATGYTVTAITVGGNTNGYLAGTENTGDVTVTSHKHTDNNFYALLTPTTKDDDATFLTLTVTKTADNSNQTLTVKGIPAHEVGKSYTYNVTVGKDGITIGSVTVKDWGSEVVIPEGEARLPVEVSPATHTITAIKPGFITAESITTALAGDTKLIVTGEVNSSDMQKLTAETTLTAINLKDATYTGGTIPPVTWGNALQRIIINNTDKNAYATAWPSVADKLFYIGIELTHKVAAMTDTYSSGIPCVVIGITGFNQLLISRNPYYGSVGKIYLPGTLAKPLVLQYNTMTAVITPWQGTVATLVDMEALLSLRPTSFTIVTAKENGNTDVDISKKSFDINSDKQEYVTYYEYSGGTLIMGDYKGNKLDTENNYHMAFITFEVTNN